MKNQALFSSKDKSKKLKCHLLQFLFSTLRVNMNFSCEFQKCRFVGSKSWVFNTMSIALIAV